MKKQNMYYFDNQTTSNYNQSNIMKREKHKRIRSNCGSTVLVLKTRLVYISCGIFRDYITYIRKYIYNVSDRYI